MKFVLTIEEDGYELRYWDEVSEEVGDSIVCEWDRNIFYRMLNDMNFNISKKLLFKGIDLIEDNKKNFIIFSSKQQDHHLDTLHDDVFYIEE
jgi:hypothetical protein